MQFVFAFVALGVAAVVVVVPVLAVADFGAVGWQRQFSMVKQKTLTIVFTMPGTLVCVIMLGCRIHLCSSAPG